MNAEPELRDHGIGKSTVALLRVTIPDSWDEEYFDANGGALSCMRELINYEGLSGLCDTGCDSKDVQVLEVFQLGTPPDGVIDE